MSNQLRLNGYSVDEAGHIECQREGDRYVQERTAIIKIDGAREVIEPLLVAADSPRALCGRKRDGSAILVFRYEGENSVMPRIAGMTCTDGEFKLQAKSGERFTITVGSKGLKFDAGAYSWNKNRSPSDVERDRLPILTHDVSTAVMDAAFKFATWAPSAEEIERETAFEARAAKLREDIASGKITLKEPTLEELMAAQDERLAASSPANSSWYDGVLGGLAAEARRRIAARRKAQTAA